MTKFLEQLPPHDIEAEEAVIAAVLVDTEAIHKLTPIIGPGDFFREKNAWIFEAAVTLTQRDEPIDQITLAHELDRQGRLDAIGGQSYLGDVLRTMPTSVGCEFYAGIVKESSTYRALINATTGIMEMAYQAPADVDGVFAKANELLERIRSKEDFKNFKHIADVLSEFLEGGDEAEFDENGAMIPPNAVLSGFKDVDYLLGGFKQSDLVIIAARPSVGKSAFALSIARNVAVDKKATVAFFSLEMSAEQLSSRLLTAESGVDATRLRLGQNTEAEERRVMNATGVLASSSIWFDDSAFLSIMDFRARLTQLMKKHPVDLVIIDYLQLMGSDKRENRVQEISFISRNLKALARQFKVPIIALSQLSRDIEKRDDKMPMLSDLRDSGSIEQDSDMVLFLNRESMYMTKERWMLDNPGMPEEAYSPGIAQLIIAKNRNGPTGMVDLRFVEHLVRFEDYATVVS